MECWLASHAGIGFAGLQALVLMNCVNWDDFFSPIDVTCL